MLIAKADHRTERGPSVIGDPSVPGANTLTTWGDPVRPIIPVRDPGTPLLAYVPPAGLDPLRVWRTQPSVRKVVDYIARSAAAVPWKVYQRADDADRQRLAASPAEQALRQPSRFITGFKLWHDVLVDACLYDAWCVAYMRLPGEDTERLHRISPRLLALRQGSLGTIEGIAVRDLASGGYLDLTDVPVAFSSGWADTGSGGVSPMTTLAAILTEQANAVEWRNRKWLTSPKLSGLLQRPADAPKWEPAQRDAFLNTWRTWREAGENTGGTPILEDGMTYDVLDTVDPADAKDIEGRQLTDAEVSSAFHIAPELVGARAGTFSNVAAFRQMLYGPALGPRLTDLEQAVNAPWSILAALDDTPDIYAELDREAAMAGSFMEQAQYLQTAIGGPYMTRAEGRGKLNLPYIEGTDELITPLNVTEGGQASPTDSGSQNTDAEAEDTAPAPSDTAPKALGAGRVVAKAATPTAAQRDELRDSLAEVARRMGISIDRGGVTDAEAFHQAWDKAAADAFAAHLPAAAERSARRVLAALNAPDDAWAAEVMANYLAAMADTHGGQLVARIIDASTEPWPEVDGEPDHAAFVAGVAAGVGVLARTALTDASGFGAHDAAHAAGARTKTWETGARPRATHSAMNGETVDAAVLFSNGLMWPGDSRGDAAETADCNCSLVYTIDD